MSLPTILVVDDDPITAAMIAEVLRAWAEVVVLDDGARVHQSAVTLAPDLILLDVLMPTTDGYLVCTKLKDDARTRDIPVIFVSTLADEGEEARGLLAGAVDYVTKPISAAILTARVRNHLEIKRQRDELERASQRDDTTGLPNRARLDGMLSSEWRRAARTRSPLSLIAASIDHFEELSRLCGPLGTREFLRRVGSAIAHSVYRPGDAAGRVGPHEFVVVLPDTDAAGGQAIAERVTAAVAGLDLPNPAVGPGGTVEVSLRVMTWRPTPGQPELDLLEDVLAPPQGAPVRGSSPGAVGTLVEARRGAPSGSAGAEPAPAQEPATPAGRLVIVDDDPVSVQVLAEVVRSAGYEVETIDRAADAIARIEASMPDLVLLDVLMPEIDGFELCRQFKSRASIASIPVMFISVVEESAEKRRAFELGAADYVGKTFHPEEVLARISYQIKIMRLQREMLEANRRLAELDRVKATFAAMLVHDLRSPLGVVQITLNLLAEKIAEMVDQDLRELIEASLEGLENTISMITELLEIYRSEHGEVAIARVRLDLGERLRRCAKAAGMDARRRRVTIDVRVTQALPVVGDGKRLERAFANLIGNALKFSLEGGRVAVDARPVAHDGTRSVRVEVRDSGRGIPEAEIPYIFDLYRQAEIGRRSGAGVGLGLAIVKRIFDAHGAKISVSSQLGIGTAFTINLPFAD